MSKQNRVGRPKGTSNQSHPAAAARLSRCPKCQSTERGPYTRTTKQAHAGVDPDGHPYTHVVRRWTRCLACGQSRIDRTYENRTGGLQKKNT